MLALITGAGGLPAAVAGALPERPMVCALEGFAPDQLKPDITFRIETLGRLLKLLKDTGIRRVCLCGHIRRPEIDLAAVDADTLPLVPRFLDALSLGDDGALRVVLALFAEAGFEIVPAHDAAPDLLPPAGVLTEAAPDAQVARDATLGDAALARMGAADQGQACVIRNGAVIATEDEAGTDAMLRALTADPPRGTPDAPLADPLSRLMGSADAFLEQAADWLSNADSAQGFLFKAPKPDQDRRADLPVIGPGTVAAVARAGLAGIVIEAGGVMLLHRAQSVAALDRAGLFLWVRERPD